MSAGRSAGQTGEKDTTGKIAAGFALEVPAEYTTNGKMQ